MAKVMLKPFLRPHLDVLFVALNPPRQSNSKGHYFSGKGSRFFKLLFLSGLITTDIKKDEADSTVFGANTINVRGRSFGVVDLVEVVETNSGKVRPSRDDVSRLFSRIRSLNPRYVCVIHSKVRDALNAQPELTRVLSYGVCGTVLRDCGSVFVLNYFPNGNAIPDKPKLEIFRRLRDLL